jgi:hypothetical protein
MIETFENRDPSARWTFSDPAPPRFAAKTKLALRAQTAVFAGAEAAGAGRPEKSPMRASGMRFSSCAKVSDCSCDRLRNYNHCTNKEQYFSRRQ